MSGLFQQDMGSSAFWLLVPRSLGFRTDPQAGKKRQVPAGALVLPQGKPGLLISHQVSLWARSPTP